MTEQTVNERLRERCEQSWTCNDRYLDEVLSGQHPFGELGTLDDCIQELWHDLSSEARAVAIICAEEICGFQDGLRERSERD